MASYSAAESSGAGILEGGNGLEEEPSVVTGRERLREERERACWGSGQTGARGRASAGLIFLLRPGLGGGGAMIGADIDADCWTAAAGAIVASRLAGGWRCASHSQQLVAAPRRNNRRPDAPEWQGCRRYGPGPTARALVRVSQRQARSSKLLVGCAQIPAGLGGAPL